MCRHDVRGRVNAPMPDPARARGLVGRVLLSSAALMLGICAAIWTGWLPLDSSIRPYVVVAFGLAGVVDGFLGLRFMGERSA